MMIKMIRFFLGCCAVFIASDIHAAQLRVNGGILHLNTSDTDLRCSRVIIETNASLSGSGCLHSDTVIAGEVAPGRPASAEAALLTFYSNVVFVGGSLFSCDIFSNTNRDQLNVSGTVSGTGQVVAVKHAACAPLEQRIIIGSTESCYDFLTVYEPQPQSWDLSVFGKELLLTDLRGDSNGDGLPDWWEVEYFGGRTNAVAQDDNDGDQSVNLGEYLAGTDPLSAASCLAVTPDSYAGSGYVLTWPGAEDRTYTVYVCTNILMDTFAVCAQDIPATLPMTVYTDTTFSAETTYYRIQATLE